MEALLAPLKAHIDSKGNETVARSAVKLNSNCRVAECNFGEKSEKIDVLLKIMILKF